MPTVDLVRCWKDIWNSESPPTLSYRRIKDAVLIDDDRGSDMRGTHIFHGPMATIYEFCSPTMRTVPSVAQMLHERGEEYGEDELRWALGEFCNRGLMVSEDGRYLSLALPANPNW
jgi:hypothetical protein